MSTVELTRICAAADVADGAILKVNAGGRVLAVANFGGTFAVTDDLCPHSEASLSEGWLEDGRVICPVHFAEFDPADGTPHNGPSNCPKARFYPVDVSAGDVFARLS